MRNFFWSYGVRFYMLMRYNWSLMMLTEIMGIYECSLPWCLFWSNVRDLKSEKCAVLLNWLMTSRDWCGGEYICLATLVLPSCMWLLKMNAECLKYSTEYFKFRISLFLVVDWPLTHMYIPPVQNWDIIDHDDFEKSDFFVDAIIVTLPTIFIGNTFYTWSTQPLQIIKSPSTLGT